jgi:hypothetical protein
MFAESVIVALLMSAPVVPSAADTVQSPDSISSEATSAPADSSRLRYRQAEFDARLARPIAIFSIIDTLPRRRRAAIEYSDWYYRRLQIHKWGSYAELPVFGAEYWLGSKLLSRNEIPGSWVKPTHAGVALALGGLFSLNTLTGVWNLYDSRHDTDQRALVWSHSALMLASDAGFVATGLLADDAGHTTAAATGIGIWASRRWEQRRLEHC